MIEIKRKKDAIKWRDVREGKAWELEVYYTLGGINYFSGGTTRRGVYVAIKPVEVTGTTVSYTLLGDVESSGLRMLLEEMPRLKSSILAKWGNKVSEIGDEIIERAKLDGVRAAILGIREKFGLKDI